MVGPSCTYDFLVNLSGRPTQLQKYHVGVLVTQQKGGPAIQQWFSALTLEEKKVITYDVVSVSDPEELAINLFDYSDTTLLRPNLGYRLIMVDGKYLKPFIASKFPKERDFNVFAGSYKDRRAPWCITSSTCSFDPHAASCLVQQRLSASLSDFTEKSRGVLGVP